ncbi:MAG: ROK family protein [Candidatus Saccharimonadales bacterium]
MIVGVDIGGTKTLIAVFAENGKLLKEVRFETNKDYTLFLQDLEQHARQLETAKAKLACVAVPGRIDRASGIALSFGNLDWRNVPIKQDVSRAVSNKNVIIENDSKLAGIAEGRALNGRYKRVLYLTLSTGIGGALIVNGKLVDALKDMEIGKIPLQHNNNLIAWEDFASGRAFYEAYGKKAVDVTDEAIWEEYAALLNPGLGVACAILQVEAIVFGGGLGQHLSRFKKYLPGLLDTTLHSIVKKPDAIITTQYRGQSVIYGCYHYAKDHLA